MTHLYHGTCQNKHSDNLPLTGQNCKDLLSLSRWKASLKHSHIFTLDVVSLAISIKSSFLPAKRSSASQTTSIESNETEKRTLLLFKVGGMSDYTVTEVLHMANLPFPESPTDLHLGKSSQSELHFLEQIS